MNSAEAGATSARRRRTNSTGTCRFKIGVNVVQPPEDRGTARILETYRLKINVRITIKRGRPRNHLSDFFWFWATKKVARKPKAEAAGKESKICPSILVQGYCLE